MAAWVVGRAISEEQAGKSWKNRTATGLVQNGVQGLVTLYVDSTN